MIKYPLGPNCTIIVGDCLDVLGDLHRQDVRVALTITDPPYESLERHRAVGTTTRLKESKSSSNPWFEVFLNSRLATLFGLLHQVHAKDSHCYMFCDSETEIVSLTGRNPYTKTHLFAGDDFVPPVHPWTVWPTLSWIKVRPGLGSMQAVELVEEDIRIGMGYHWRRSSERILFLEKGKRKLNNLGWPDTLLGERAGKNDFPTAKPFNLIRRLIQNSSNVGDLVLDPFAGSGVVGTAALSLNRRCILIEKHPSEWLLNKAWPAETSWRK